MGSQAHELSIFPGSWKGSTFHCSPLVIRWLLAYWAARDSHHLHYFLQYCWIAMESGLKVFISLKMNGDILLPWTGIFHGLDVDNSDFQFPWRKYQPSFRFSLALCRIDALNASEWEWESDSSQWIRHFSFYMMCWGICFSNATSRLQISRNWLLLDHFPFNLGSPSETKMHKPMP